MNREGLVQSQRGRDGGYQLAKAPDQVRIGDLVRMTNYHWSFSIEETRLQLGLETLVVAGSGPDAQDPRHHCVGIAVDPVQQLVYWTQKGASDAGQGRIFRCRSTGARQIPIEGGRLGLRIFLHLRRLRV